MMRFRRPLMLVAALAVIAPGTAAAQDVRVIARDVPLVAARASATRSAPLAFTLVGSALEEILDPRLRERRR